QLRTNLPARDPAFFGYNFTRWIMRFHHHGASLPRPVDQTLEILIDDDSGTSELSQGFRVFTVSDPDATSVLINPTAGNVTPLVSPLVRADGTADPQAPFVLDGRFLRAFNGPGLGPMAVYANFRVNGGLLGGKPEVLAAGDPDVMGMDEDYDACDLENWFLAI